MFSFGGRTETERETSFSCVYIHRKVIAAFAVYCLEDDFLPLRVEAQNVAYQPLTFGQLFHRDVFDMLAACGFAFPVAFEAGGDVA